MAKPFRTVDLMKLMDRQLRIRQEIIREDGMREDSIGDMVQKQGTSPVEAV
jgi:hypothetical protein